MRVMTPMGGVRAHGGIEPVHLRAITNDVTVPPRWVVTAQWQDGYDYTDVDLLDLIAWLRENRPDLLDPVS
jgi:hypothetical protein